jgi:hypothetical protein
VQRPDQRQRPVVLVEVQDHHPAIDVLEVADGRERRTAFRAAAARLPVAQRCEAERHAAAGEVVADSIQGQAAGRDGGAQRFRETGVG